MEEMSNKTVDDIQKRYQYTIDPLDDLSTALFEYSWLFGEFIVTLKHYKFDENIMKLKKKIQMKKDKIEESKLESLDKTLTEISDECKKIDQKARLDFNEISSMLTAITNDYKSNKNKPGAAEIYVKISSDIIDKEASKYIQYEKKLILYNDLIIDIKKNLDN